MSKIDILEYLEAIPDIPKEDFDKVIETPCPCGGTLECMRVKSNGHLRAKCNLCGFFMIE